MAETDILDKAVDLAFLLGYVDGLCELLQNRYFFSGTPLLKIPILFLI